jgi:hypothetical protein
VKREAHAWQCVLLLAALAAALLVERQPVGAAESVRFAFAPRDGTRAIVVTKMSRKKFFAGRSQIDKSTAYEDRRFKKVAGGYQMIAVLKVVFCNRDGVEYLDPALMALSSVPLTFIIAKSGRATAIKGYDKVVEALRKNMPPEATKALGNTITKEALAAREIEEWDARIGDFVGKTAKVGDVWNGESEYALSSGQKIKHKSTVKFMGWETVAGKRCLRVRYVYWSDASDLGDLVDKKIAEIYKSLEMKSPRPRAADVQFRGAGERLIDPSTMLIYGETGLRVTGMQMRTGASKGEMTLIDRRDYKYRYY